MNTITGDKITSTTTASTMPMITPVLDPSAVLAPDGCVVE